MEILPGALYYVPLRLSLYEHKVAILHWLRGRFLKVPLPGVAGGNSRRILNSFLPKPEKRGNGEYEI